MVNHLSSNMLNFIAVTTPAHISEVANLANTIWSAHYTQIIGLQQVDYMLNNFQSKAAISQQIEDKFKYFLVESNKQFVGYFALAPIESNSLQISKLYISQNQQRCGIGSRTISFIEAYCKEQKVTQVWLTVNRHNSAAIHFYKQAGFKKAGSLIQDIGNDFVMDDYKMTKTIAIS